MGTQRALGTSKRGFDHLLLPGLGPDANMRQTMALGTAFDQDAKPDADIAFTAEVFAHVGPAMATWRATQMETMCRLKLALNP